jgi:hypothetical protein
VSTELVVRQPYQPQSLDDVEKLGKAMAASGFFKDARQAAQAVVKVLAGQELGIPPVAAMRGIHVVEGKLELSGTLTGALIKRHDWYDYRVVSSNEERCEIEFLQRKGVASQEFESIGIVVWTMEDARRAGLAGGANWKKYPRAMLFNRAMTEGARMHCPDVFDGPIYAEGEISEAVAVEADEPDAELVAAASEEGSEPPAGSQGGTAVAEPAISEPSPDPVEAEVVEVEDVAVEGEAEQGAAPSPSGDPKTDLLEAFQASGLKESKVFLLARRKVGDHISKAPIADGVVTEGLSDEDAVALATAIREETK